MKIYTIVCVLLAIAHSNGKKSSYRDKFKPRKVARERVIEREVPEVTLPPPTFFDDIVRSSVFVDKTMMLKDFINLAPGQSHVMITCPKNFGKSTNLDMIRRFFQADIDVNTGIRRNKMSTSAYQLFNDPLLNLSIARDQQFIEEHLGEYPVVYLSFDKIRGDSSKTLVKGICQRIRQLLRSYEWLYKLMKKKVEQSNNKYEKENLEIFANLLVKEGDEWDSTNGLSILVSYLRGFLNRNVILLVDDFDSPLLEMLSNGVYPEETQNFLESIMQTFLKENNHTSHAIFAGITHLPKMCQSSKFYDVDHCSFLSNHPFVEYFGFTVAEIQNLLKTDRTVNHAAMKKYFDGYYVVNRSISLYEPKGVRRYILHQPIDIVDVTDDETFKIINCAKHEKFLEYLLKLIGANVVSFELVTCSDTEDLDAFIKMIRTECATFEQGNENLYFSHLFEYGYLSYANDPSSFRIPNVLAQQKIKKELTHYYKKTSGIDLIRPAIGLAMNEILNEVNTSFAILTNLTSEINDILRMRNKVLDDFQQQAIVFSSIFCNFNTTGETIKIKKSSGAANESMETTFNHMIIMNDDRKSLLIIQLTMKRKARKAVESARKLIPFEPKNSSQLTMIKYLGMNLDNLGTLEIERGPNIYDW